MMMLITAMAAAAAAQTAQPAPAPTAPAQQMQGQMDHSKMPMGQMDHSKMGGMAMGQTGDGCCVKTADGKMECRMPDKAATAPSR